MFRRRFDQSKEGYLEFMNYFIDDEKRNMREFLKNISVRCILRNLLVGGLVGWFGWFGWLVGWLVCYFGWLIIGGLVGCLV